MIVHMFMISFQIYKEYYKKPGKSYNVNFHKINFFYLTIIIVVVLKCKFCHVKLFIGQLDVGVGLNLSRKLVRYTKRQVAQCN